MKVVINVIEVTVSYKNAYTTQSFSGIPRRGDTISLTKVLSNGMDFDFNSKYRVKEVIWNAITEETKDEITAVELIVEKIANV